MLSLKRTFGPRHSHPPVNVGELLDLFNGQPVFDREEYATIEALATEVWKENRSKDISTLDLKGLGPIEVQVDTLSKDTGEETISLKCRSLVQMVRRQDTRQYWLEVIKGAPPPCDQEKIKILREKWESEWNSSKFSRRLNDALRLRRDQIKLVDHIFLVGSIFSCAGSHNYGNEAPREAHMFWLLAAKIYAFVHGIYQKQSIRRHLGRQHPKLSIVCSRMCDACATYYEGRLADILGFVNFETSGLGEFTDYRALESKLVRNVGPKSVVIIQDCDIPVMQLIGDLLDRKEDPAAILGFKLSPSDINDTSMDVSDCWHPNLNWDNFAPFKIHFRRYISTSETSTPKPPAPETSTSETSTSKTPTSKPPNKSDIFQNDMAVVFSNTHPLLAEMDENWKQIFLGDLRQWDLHALLNENDLSELERHGIKNMDEFCRVYERMLGATDIASLFEDEFFKMKTSEAGKLMKKLVPVLKTMTDNYGESVRKRIRDAH